MKPSLLILALILAAFADEILSSRRITGDHGLCGKMRVGVVDHNLAAAKELLMLLAGRCDTTLLFAARAIVMQLGPIFGLA